jgi:hypothetical protein
MITQRGRPSRLKVRTSPGLHDWLGSLPGMALGGFSAPDWFGLLGVVAAVVVGYVWDHRWARRYLLVDRLASPP